MNQNVAHLNVQYYNLTAIVAFWWKIHINKKENPHESQFYKLETKVVLDVSQKGCKAKPWRRHQSLVATTYYNRERMQKFTC
jgi:hypothetical protein